LTWRLAVAKDASVKAPALKTFGRILPALILASASAIITPGAHAVSIPIASAVDASLARIAISADYTDPGLRITTTDSRAATVQPGAGAALDQRLLFPVDRNNPDFNGDVEFARARAGVTVAQTPTGLAGSGWAQTSATTSGGSIYDLAPHGRAEAMAVFDVFFTLLAPTAFTLTGWLDVASGDYGSVLLQSAADGSPTAGGPAASIMGNPGIVDLAGMLDLGTYELRAVVSALSIGDRHDADFGRAMFDLALDFGPGPAVGDAAGPAFTAAAAPAAGVGDYGSTAALLMLGFAALVTLSRKIGE
jgi:hypothetical protein